MTASLADYWHLEYQPTIDELQRPDSGWNWPSFHGWYEKLAGLLGQAPFAYCLGVENQSRHFVPVGMIMLAGRYPALNNHSQSAVFAWFVSAAPEKLVSDRVGANVPRGVGQALMDIALTHSGMSGYLGRMGLHADPKGGEQLMDFYHNRVQLMNLNSSAKLPRARRLFGNDGRYFYADEEQASMILGKQQENR